MSMVNSLFEIGPSVATKDTALPPFVHSARTISRWLGVHSPGRRVQHCPTRWMCTHARVTSRVDVSGAGIMGKHLDPWPAAGMLQAAPQLWKLAYRMGRARNHPLSVLAGPLGISRTRAAGGKFGVSRTQRHPSAARVHSFRYFGAHVAYRDAACAPGYLIILHRRLQ